MAFFSLFRSKLERETENERQELVEIVKKIDEPNSMDKLQNLALRVGASIYGVTEYHTNQCAIQPELIHNIHLALQTKAMIAAVKTTSNYVIATILLALIAFGGMVANFIVVFKVK
jgi:hypothetical protein